MNRRAVVERGLIFVGIALLTFAGGNDHWRMAYPELLRRTFVTRTEASRLAKVLPADAMVVGRRAPTLLRQTHCRLGLAYPGYPPEEYLQKLRKML